MISPTLSRIAYQGTSLLIAYGIAMLLPIMCDLAFELNAEMAVVVWFTVGMFVMRVKKMAFPMPDPRRVDVSGGLRLLWWALCWPLYLRAGWRDERGRELPRTLAQGRRRVSAAYRPRIGPDSASNWPRIGLDLIAFMYFLHKSPQGLRHFHVALFTLNVSIHPAHAAMLITIFSDDAAAKRSILALNLARLCARERRRALLIDATSCGGSLGWDARRRSAGVKSRFAVRGAQGLLCGLANPDAYCRLHYPDIIVELDKIASGGADAALIASDVLLIPVRSRPDAAAARALIHRIEALRLLRPSLRVLVVAIQSIRATDGGSAGAGMVSVRFFVRDVATATLAETVIHEWFDDRGIFQRGLSAFEGDARNTLAATEIEQLYREMRHLRDLPLDVAANNAAIMNAIRRNVPPAAPY